MPQRHSDISFSALMFAVQCLEDGDVNAVIDLGFSPDDIREIETLTLQDINLLKDNSLHFIKVEIDTKRFRMFRQIIDNHRRERDLIGELIRHHACFPMMVRLFGMQTIEYSRLRKKLGMIHGFNGRMHGRPALPDIQTTHRIWEIWQITGDMPPADRYLHIAREIAQPLNMIWQVLKGWDLTGPTIKPTPARGDTRQSDVADTKPGVTTSLIDASTVTGSLRYDRQVR